MKRGLLLVRADASVAAGTGHVMRCLALAQAWRRAGGDAIFAMAQSTPAIQERLRSEPVEVVIIQGIPGSADDLRQTIDAALFDGAEWLVLDGYHFGAHYVSQLQNVRPLLLIDDNGELESYSSELLLNQNVHARAEMYSKRAPRTRLLLGPRYTLLRNEFTAYRDWERKVAERGTRVLVTMGGSDPKDLTPRVLAALARLPIDDLQIRVVVSGSAKNRSEVAATAARFPGRVELMSDASVMAELMAWADFAIAGAGTTCWEMCLLGLPAILVVVAGNQRSIAEHLAGIGAAVNAGPAELLDCSTLAHIAAELVENKDRRVRMSQVARRLVDGLGSERVCSALQGRELRLRLVDESDCRLLFEWADDPAARAASFHSAVIPWEEHVSWFAERLRDPRSVIYIGENAAGHPVGLVRFQIQDVRAVMSVNVAPQFRGQGWGRELIAFSLRSLARESTVRRVEAFVKPDNQASLRVFEASGFRLAGQERVADQAALLFTWECGNGTHVG